MSAPERIYGWRNSYFSVARYYGSCNYQGHHYIVDMTDPDEPLVRADVLTKEKKAELQLKRDMAQVETLRKLMAQGNLL